MREPRVAPHVGAWIEIEALPLMSIGFLSRPTWARGLKFVKQP